MGLHLIERDMATMPVGNGHELLGNRRAGIDEGAAAIEEDAFYALETF